MSKTKGRGELLADRLSLPADMISNGTKLTVYGRKRALVENHCGIISYEPNAVKLDCGSMKISLRGDDLMIAAMDNKDLAVTGRLRSIEFE